MADFHKDAGHTEESADTRQYFTIIRHWQRELRQMNFCIMLTMFIIEMLFFIVYRENHWIKIGEGRYMIHYLLVPTVFNLMVFFLAEIIRYTGKSGEVMQALLPFFVLILLISNVIVTHYEFTVLLGLIAIPLFVSVIYGSRVITRKIFVWLNLAFLADVALICFLRKPMERPGHFLLEVLLTYLLLLYSYIMASIIVRYEEKKERLLGEQYRLNQELQKEVYCDGLTGIYNYSGMKKELESQMAAFQRGDELHLAIIDVDLFKNVNDVYGHEAGNAVLANLGKILRDNASANVIPARYGGEEFAVIFRDMTMNEANRTVKDIQNRFQKSRYTSFAITREITFSAGIASYIRGKSDSEWIQKADRALYQAKNAGRNQICIFKKSMKERLE